METRWLKRKDSDTSIVERFYPITHAKAIVTDDGETVEAKLEKITVTSNIPIHLSINSELGTLQITY